jgi:hypothetical protein
VNPDFIKSNYLTCSNKNVKKTIKIYDGKQMVIHHQSSRYNFEISLYLLYTSIPAHFPERPTINLYYRYHVVK